MNDGRPGVRPAEDADPAVAAFSGLQGEVAEVVAALGGLRAEVSGLGRRLERLDGVLRRGVQESNRRERCTARLEVVSQSKPAPCDPRWQEILSEAAEALTPGGWRRMPSGAGHDAVYVARRVPAAMVFVPCRDGLSHNEAEHVEPEQAAAGCQVLFEAVLARANRVL